MSSWVGGDMGWMRLRLVAAGCFCIVAFQNCDSFDPQQTSQDSSFQVRALRLTYQNAPAPTSTPIHYDNSISTDETDLDLMYDMNNVRPLVVFIHGGGWKAGGKENSLQKLGPVFFNEGYAFATLNYPLLKVNANQEPIQFPVVCASGIPDCSPVDRSIPTYIAKALTVLRGFSNSKNLDFSKVFLVGHSAGAHLAALTVANPTYLQPSLRESIRGIILLDSPVSHFQTIVGIRPVLGLNVGGQLNLASPAYHVSRPQAPAFPPLYQFYGPNSAIHDDPINTEQQAADFRKALAAKGARVVWSSLYNIPHGDFYHELHREAPQTNIRREVFEFLDRVLDTNKDLLLSSHVFDWQAYVGFNNPLVDSWILNRGWQNGLFQDWVSRHWQNSGLAAGRQASPKFSAQAYMDQNANVSYKYRGDQTDNINAEGDKVGATLDYINRGRVLGLGGVPSKKIFGAALPDSAGSLSGDAVYGNSKIKIVTAAKYSGAIESVFYNGENIIDASGKAYGRLFQLAIWKYGLGKCYNPIEAGSRYHDSEQQKSSILTSISSSAAGLLTNATPALFRRLGEDGCDTAGVGSALAGYLPRPNQINDQRYNSGSLTPNLQFEKSISFLPNDEKAFNFRATVHNFLAIQAQAGVNPFIVQLYAALKVEFSQIRMVDFSLCTSSMPISNPNCALKARPEGYSATRLVVMTRPSDGLSFAMHSPSSNIPIGNGYVAPTYQGKRHIVGSENDVNDLSVNFATSELSVGDYTFDVRIFMGSAEEVRERVIQSVRGL